MRRVLSTAVVALIIAALAGIPSGAIAQSDPADDPISPSAVTRGLNADKIDGKHASRYTLRRAPRAKKVVATNRVGMLPPNIIEPLWPLIQGKPAFLADNQVHWNEIVGKPATVITATAPCPSPLPAASYVVFPNLPRQATYDFQIVPHSTPGVIMYIDRVETLVDPGGTISMGVRVVSNTAGGACNIRASALVGEGISVASARNHLNKANVHYNWK